MTRSSWFMGFTNKYKCEYLPRRCLYSLMVSNLTSSSQFLKFSQSRFPLWLLREPSNMTRRVRTWISLSVLLSQLDLPLQLGPVSLLDLPVVARLTHHPGSEHGHRNDAVTEGSVQGTFRENWFNLIWKYSTWMSTIVTWYSAAPATLYFYCR